MFISPHTPRLHSIYRGSGSFQKDTRVGRNFDLNRLQILLHSLSDVCDRLVVLSTFHFIVDYIFLAILSRLIMHIIFSLYVFNLICNEYRTYFKKKSLKYQGQTKTMSFEMRNVYFGGCVKFKKKKKKKKPKASPLLSGRMVSSARAFNSKQKEKKEYTYLARSLC